MLGDGTTTNRSTPVQVSGLSGAVAIAAGCAHSLALKSDGTVWAWGNNWWGQVGDGTTTSPRTTPLRVSALSGVVAIAAGCHHSLALKSDGTVWAWGYNSFGQLGDATNTNRFTPVRVSGVDQVKVIAGGWWYSLAGKSDGTARAWGDNSGGQLGDGTAITKATPVPVVGLTGAVRIFGGNTHTLAIGASTLGPIGDGASDTL